MKALIVIAGLAVGDFIYAYFWSGNYSAAFERSFFQAMAILIYVSCPW